MNSGADLDVLELIRGDQVAHLSFGDTDPIGKLFRSLESHLFHHSSIKSLSRHLPEVG
jgi:hypothetical protein